MKGGKSQGNGERGRRNGENKQRNIEGGGGILDPNLMPPTHPSD